MENKLLFALMLVSANAALADEGSAAQKELWQQQVRQTECGFAASMARRDLAAFEGFVTEPAVFFGGAGALEGKAAVLAGWRPFFAGEKAPFSWEPDLVTVVGDGSLAVSTGPVFNPEGQLIGRFNSVWRQESPGRWRIIIDRGLPLTDAERAQAPKPGKGCEGQ